MTPLEYRTAIAALGLSQVKAAVALGVDQRTSRRWATGRSRIPRSVELLLRAMQASPEVTAPLKQPRAKRKAARHGQDKASKGGQPDNSKAVVEVVHEAPVLTENERRELWIRQHGTGE